MNPTPHLLVCVTDPARGLELISIGRQLADKQEMDLKVLAVLRHPKDPKNATVMQTLYNLCARFSAELTVLFRKNPALTMAMTAKRTDAAGLLCDVPPIAGQDFVACLRELLPDISISVLDESDTLLTFPPRTVHTV